MEEQKKNGGTKKIIFIVVGILLILGTLAGGNLKYIFNWSTAELAGYNTWSLIAIIGGGYLIYLGRKK